MGPGKSVSLDLSNWGGVYDFPVGFSARSIQRITSSQIVSRCEYLHIH